MLHHTTPVCTQNDSVIERRGPSRLQLAAAWGTALMLLGGTVAIHAQSSRRPGGGAITVHGHWTIDIHDADGALASHHEFENALEPSGASALAGLLGRAYQPTSWRLELASSDSAGACVRAPADHRYTATFTPLDPIRLDAPVIRDIVFVNPTTIQVDFEDRENDAGVAIVEVGGADRPSPPGLELVSIVNTFGSTEDGHSYKLVRALIAWDADAPPSVYKLVLRLPDHLGHFNDFVVTLDLSAGPPDPGSASYPCSAVEAGSGIPGELAEAWFPTLGLALVGGKLELTGSVRATNAEAIEQVRSVIVLSNSAVMPFSSRALQTPIQVVAGQTVSVKVVFTFS